jgi:hypothetical protein
VTLTVALELAALALVVLALVVVVPGRNRSQVSCQSHRVEAEQLMYRSQ